MAAEDDNTPDAATARTQPHARGTPGEVFVAFLRLGLTSFGGPVAHLAYFRAEFVTRRAWLSEAAYADLVALCQFLPGPASSQTGFALGLMRAGWLGALAAFAAFTLPSALLLVGFALTAATLAGPIGLGLLQGLKIVAVAIVAQAVLGMARALCPDRERASIAVGAVAVLAVWPGAVWPGAGGPGAGGMVVAIVLGLVAGLALARAGVGRGAPAGAAGDAEAPFAHVVRPWQAWLALMFFAALLLILPALAPLDRSVAVVDGFYRAGALVFGGGHVVLPLLETEVVRDGWVTQETFLAGYGAAQAVPGPLFTFAAYLGASLSLPPNGLAGAGLALGAVFLPGFLILIATLPHWDRLRGLPAARAALNGANAAVVGILGAALYDPVFTGAIDGPASFALSLACFVLLVAWQMPPWLVVLVGAAGGAALALVG